MTIEDWTDVYLIIFKVTQPVQGVISILEVKLASPVAITILSKISTALIIAFSIPAQTSFVRHALKTLSQEIKTSVPPVSQMLRSSMEPLEIAFASKGFITKSQQMNVYHVINFVKHVMDLLPINAISA